MAHGDGTTGWAQQAKCKGQAPDQFFVRGSQQARKALRLCSRCVVREECLEYAIAEGMDYGIWGGLTERQRRAHVRKLAG